MERLIKEKANRLTGYDADGELIVCEEERLLCSYGIITKDEMYKIMRHLAEKLAEYEDLEERGLLLKLLCKVGDIVYRICPKCNDKHDGSCKNCAWSGSLSNCGCDVYGLWSDGQFPPEECTIVPYKVSWNYIPNLLEHLGKTVFLTQAEAEEALKRMEK